jgi:hypothetical protein
VNAISDRLNNQCLDPPGLAIDTNFDVQTGAAIVYLLAGARYDLASGVSCDTGTSAGISTNNYWAVMLVSVDNAGALTGTWADNAGAGYSTEALAIAALPAVPANQVAIGFVAVKTGAGAAWDAGTDALEGGTGGDPSADTNYYDYVGTVIDTISFREVGAPS